jgi:predicted MFS family arabinose efflux permease
MAQTRSFWALILCVFCGSGSGLVFILNASQLCRAEGLPVRTEDLLVSVLGIGNTCGRVASGFVSDALAVRGWHRPWFLCFALAIQACLNFLLWLFSDSAGVILPAAFLTGFLYGSMWSLGPACVSEVFGLKYFGTNYAILSFATPLATVVFADELTSFFYGRALKKGGRLGPHSPLCVGADCFSDTFLTLSLACCIGSVAGAVLSCDTRGLAVYKRQVAVVG